MPQVNFYSDATRGSTLKALQQRRAEIQAAQEAAMAPRQISAPSQGWAQIADVVGGGIREARAANEETAARQRFAELMAGGLSQEEMGEAMGIDPDIAMKYQTHQWDVEQADREAQARRDELVQKHGWDVDAATARVQAEKDAAAARVQAEQEAAAKAADVAAGVATTEHERDVSETKRVEGEKLRQEQVTAVPPEIAAQRGGDIQRNPGKYEFHPATGDVVPVGTAGVGATSPKEIYDAQDRLASIDSHMDDLNRALELNENIIQGPIGKGASELAGWDPIGVVEGVVGPERMQQLNNTKEFYQLVSAGAMTRMAEELKGSTAYQELMHYQELFASPTATAEVRRNALQGMLNTLKKHREVSSARLTEYGSGTPDPYKYTPRTSTEPAATGGAAGGATGGAAGGGPVVTIRRVD